MPLTSLVYFGAMQLEDHVGDIIKKARFIAGTSLEAAAKSAGVSPEQLGQIEETGKLTPGLDFPALGKLIDLNGTKLQRIAAGWRPAEPDLSTWRELRRITTGNENLRVHCYVVWDEITREAALFDTGLDAAPVLALVDTEKLQLKHIFITHSHYDHVEGLAGVRQRFPIARLHTNSKSAPPQHRIRSNDFIHLGSLRITNRDTPGHAEDGVTYVIGNFSEDAPNVAMVGDAIFAGSIGGAKQDPKIARPKIKTQILSLPPATLICPGHGPFTTVAEELENNPFF